MESDIFGRHRRPWSIDRVGVVQDADGQWVENRAEDVVAIVNELDRVIDEANELDRTLERSRWANVIMVATAAGAIVWGVLR